MRMRTYPTETALAIFDSIKRKYASAIFLANGELGPRLSFGVNQTDQLTYCINLQTPTSTISLSSKNSEPFALLLDDLGEQGHLRLVLYMPGDAQPHVETNGVEGDSLLGQILIYAQAQNGVDRAVLHAVFAPDGQSSLIMDSSVKLSRHLNTCAKLFKMEGTSHAG